MPKICINGITREMTPEEATGIPEQTKPELEQRIEELEGALNLLIGGATE